MDANNSMCGFCELKQKSFDEACYAFARTENMEGIARVLNMPPGMLRNKLNPEQPHVLKPVELIAVSKVSGNYTLLNCLLFELNVVTAPIENSDEAETILSRLLKHNVNAGEISAWALEHGNTPRFSRTSKHSLIKKAQEGISNLVLLINDVENRTSGASPILSMGVDLIANGAPIPGFA
ncbi:phage regulatory CII family protein [Vibrio sp. Of7-15]|uniref:phage regulatory CII family protein n=1 Tax=Vibrio sp. Of7-15 TaxID=2724879 RepID=UPI001EF3200B|nr:phage regulatory CII family protein [Vibrio sp. Of7-15]MCG7499347.1 phage regulatory CII family protein [Vibrio sp. Of7-15]